MPEPAIAGSIISWQGCQLPETGFVSLPPGHTCTAIFFRRKREGYYA
jgi:hypothetical protein